MKHPITHIHTAHFWRANNFVSVLRKWLLLLGCLFLAISVKAQNFVLFGNQLINNLSTVNGDVGVSGGGNLDLMAPATINGNLYLDTTATLTQDGVINGTTFDNQNLASVQNGVFSGSAGLATFPANQTITGDQTAALNFNVPSGIYVVNLNGGLDLNNQNITLTGAGTLVLNIENSFSLAGSASIVGNPRNIQVNYIGSSTVTTGPGDSVSGTVYIPDAAANLAGTWTGVIWGGGDPITLDSGATINPVPEPAVAALMSVGFVPFILLACRRFWGLKSSV